MSRLARLFHRSVILLSTDAQKSPVVCFLDLGAKWSFLDLFLQAEDVQSTRMLVTIERRPWNWTCQIGMWVHVGPESGLLTWWHEVQPCSSTIMRGLKSNLRPFFAALEELSLARHRVALGSTGQLRAAVRGRSLVTVTKVTPGWNFAQLGGVYKCRRIEGCGRGWVGGQGSNLAKAHGRKAPIMEVTP